MGSVCLRVALENVFPSHAVPTSHRSTQPGAWDSYPNAIASALTCWTFVTRRGLCSPSRPWPRRARGTCSL